MIPTDRLHHYLQRGEQQGVFAPAAASLARALLDKAACAWTERQRMAAEQIVMAHRAQLRRSGVRVEETPAHGGSVSWSRERSAFEVRFRYDPEVNARFKQCVALAAFNREQKFWLVPRSQEPSLRAFAQRHGMSFSAAPPAPAAGGTFALSGPLRPFQQTGVAFLRSKRRALLADDMGLGKTVQAIAAVAEERTFPCVVVCPATLRINWRREFERWLPGVRVSIASTSSGRLSTDAAADVHVINYERLIQTNDDARKVRPKFPVADALMALKPRALVVDESHYCKAWTAKRTKAVCRLADSPSLAMTILLTGTPILNRPYELVSQLRIIGRLGELGGRDYFIERYCCPEETRYGMQMRGADNLDELNRKLSQSCMLRRLKKDVLSELPEKTRAIVPVEIDNRAEYRRAEAEFLQWLSDLEGRDAAFRASLAEALVRMEKLKALAARGKMKQAVEWIEQFLEQDEKLVVFATHREIVEQVAGKFGCPVILGGQSQAERQAAVDRFQSDRQCRMLISNIAAGGVGLTLTAASNVAFLELGWSPGEHEQAEDRVHRIGQHDAVTAWYLLADGTIDMALADLIDAKRRIIAGAVDGADPASESVAKQLLTTLLNKERAR